jgi:hypothetical protein
MMIKRWLQNPVIHFLVLGALLFSVREGWRALNGARAGGAGRAPIVISAERIARLQADFSRQAGMPPTQEQLQALIRDTVDDELLYREARRLQLDFQDRSIRTRLVQKMRAVSSNPAQEEEALYREAVRLGLDDDLVIKRVLREKMRLILEEDPNPVDLQEQDVRDYLLRHRERFAQPETLTFSHVFLSARARGGRLDEAARTALAKLRAQSAQPQTATAWSDPFPLGLQLPSQSRDALARYFGADFAEQVFALQPGVWAGPIASPFGQHLVWVHQKSAEQLPPLELVWQQVTGQLRQERSAERYANALRRLRDLYEIRVEKSISTPPLMALEQKHP